MGYEVPEYRLPVLDLQHFHDDGIAIDWIRIILEDGTWLQCDVNRALDNAASCQTTCEKPKPEADTDIEQQPRQCNLL